MDYEVNMEFHGPHRSIVAETVVPANPAQVWQAWTTEEGLRTFFSPHVTMELRVGGPFQILFNVDAPVGLRGADDMRVMAYENKKMLAFDWNAPPELPEIRPQRTHVTVYFEGTCGGGTRVTLIHDGWGTSGKWDAAIAYFEGAWKEVVLPRLRCRFESGPVDWKNRPDLSVLARKGQLLQVFDQEQRFSQAYPHTVRSTSMGVIRYLVPAEKRGFIAYSHLDERIVDQAIADQIEFFTAQKSDFEWKVYDHDTPADLKIRLASTGLVPEEPEALMLMDMDHAPDSFFQPTGLDIRRITRSADLKGLQSVEQAVWNEDWSRLLINLAKDLDENPDIVSVYMGYDGSKPVCGAWTYFHPGTHFASFWGGSTLTEYRGKGFYTGLLAQRASEARERGFRYLTVDASPMSRPILEKYGFLFLTFSTPYNWASPAR